MSAEPITVRIYGEAYTLRSGEPAARLEELARYVDARMREVAASGKVVATTRIAVLAALHLADELFRQREKPAVAPPDPGLESRLDALCALLERSLEPAGGD